MIRVLIVDDHPIVRDGLEVLLASEKGLSIHGSVASAEEAVALCEKKGAPDVVVTDVHMPGGMTGLELAARLKKTCPSARVHFTTPSTTAQSMGAWLAMTPI